MTTLKTPKPGHPGSAPDRTTLTERYLGEITRAGATARELLGRLPEAELPKAFYHGRDLSRPLFLGDAERTQLDADLENVRAALVSIPDRIYGGDLAAFARAVGESGYPVSAILRSRGRLVSRLARADLYADESGFHLLEFNMGSALVGLDNADICRAMLEHPLLAEFAGTHRLSYVDTMREQITSLLAESGLPPGSFPVVAVTDWPSSYAGKLGSYMGQLAERWRELGLDAHPCHIGELETRNGRVWLHGRAVDVIARMFVGLQLLEPEAPGLMEPIIGAVARGEVQIFTPLDSELFGSKAALAMLSDQANRDLFTPAELASFDRLLPWTRMVRPGKVTLEDGQRTDLLDYAIRHQRELVLKPTGSCGGEGVVLGWHPATSPALWREQLASAAGNAAQEGYVIQRRIRPVPELFPDDDGRLIPWIVTWGAFTGVNGYSGAYTRALTVQSGGEVINLGKGAAVGCCLSARAEPGPGPTEPDPARAGPDPARAGPDPARAQAHRGAKGRPR